MEQIFIATEHTEATEKKFLCLFSVNSVPSMAKIINYRYG